MIWNWAYFWPDVTVEICSPVNVLIRFFRPRDNIGQVGCDTDNKYFCCLGSNMDFG